MRFYHPTTAAWLERVLLNPLDRFSRGELIAGLLIAVAVIWFAFGYLGWLVIR